MADILVTIPGPTFLFLFSLLYFVVLFSGKLLTKFDGSMSWRMPEPTRFPPIGVAALTGGTKEVLRTALFNMVNKKVITISGTGPLTKVSRLKIKGAELTDPVEVQIFEYLKSPETPREIFKDPELLTMIDFHMKPLYREFEDLRLIQSDSDRFWIWIVTALAELTVVAVGGTKLWLGMARDKPGGFLVVLFIGAVLTLFYFLRPRVKVKTRLGLAYVKKLKEHFNWLKDSCVAGKTPEGIDPALPLALFGPVALTELAVYGFFSKAFTPPNTSYSWSNQKTSGGCGSGCSSGCGSGGGGGCGSGCGGGCGGCG